MHFRLFCKSFWMKLIGQQVNFLVTVWIQITFFARNFNLCSSIIKVCIIFILMVLFMHIHKIKTEQGMILSFILYRIRNILRKYLGRFCQAPWCWYMTYCNYVLFFASDTIKALFRKDKDQVSKSFNLFQARNLCYSVLSLICGSPICSKTPCELFHEHWKSKSACIDFHGT